MNKELLVRFAIFSISAAASSLITAQIVKARYEQYTQEQIQEVKDYFYGSVVEKVYYPETDEKEEPEDNSKEEIVEDEVPKEGDYKRLMQVYGRDSAPVTQYETIPNVQRDEPIFLIKKEEYYSDEGDFEKESLTYYTEDDVLVDFSGDVIRDYSDVVGNEFHDTFQRVDQTFSTWVRNDKTLVDYEIDRVQGAYTEVVLGLLPYSDDE